MKYLFVHAEHGRRPCFPSAIGYLAAAILQVEPEAKIDVLDLNIENDIKKLSDETYEFIFISALSAHFRSVEATIQFIKEHNRRSVVVLGGMIVTSMPEKIIDALNANLYVIGEGEITIQELITGVPKNKITGIGYKDVTGQITINPARPLIKDLDTIPFPAWHVFNSKYIDIYRKSDGLWDYNFNVLASRGCPMRCNFCFRNFNGTYRSRSIDNVLDEIEVLIEKYNIGIATFIDEYFFVNKKTILKFCQRIHDRKMKFRWSCAIRVEIADKDMFGVMKKAGCYMMQIGTEHGSQKMLDAMNKQSTVEANIECMNLLRDSRLYVGAGIIIGYPGETADTIREGEAMMCHVGLPAGYHFVQACPGTPLWKYAVENGYITDEITYLRNSFDSDTTLKLNFTDMPTEYILAERRRILSNLNKYSMNNGFNLQTKIYLQAGFYIKQLCRGELDFVIRKMFEDFKKILHFQRLEKFTALQK